MSSTAASSKAWRQRNPEWVRAKNRERRLKRKRLLQEIKMAAGCKDCGFNEHPAALHFDHVRGEKKFELSELLTNSWEACMKELIKCEVVCANCHAIRTENRRLAQEPPPSIHAFGSNEDYEGRHTHTSECYDC